MSISYSLFQRKIHHTFFNLIVSSDGMKVTVKEGWNKQSKMAIAAMAGSIIVIVSVIMLD